MPGTCSCGRTSWARGLCNSCYKVHRYRLRAAGQWDPDDLICAEGTTRRLQALSAIGWPYRTLALELGLSNDRSVLPPLMAGGREQVRASTARRVAQLFNRKKNFDGPSEVSRKRAIAKGWAPPSAWRRRAIDNPTAQPGTPPEPAPVPVVVERTVRDVRCGDCEHYPCACHWADDADVPLIGHLEGGEPIAERLDTRVAA